MPNDDQEITTTRPARSRVASSSRKQRGRDPAKPAPSASQGVSEPGAGAAGSQQPRRTRARRGTEETISPPPGGGAQPTRRRKAPGSRTSGAVPAGGSGTVPAGEVADPAEVTHDPGAQEPVVESEHEDREVSEREVSEAGDVALDAVSSPLVLTSELTGPLRCAVKVQALKSVLGMMASALPTRLSLPVLGHVMLAAEGDGQLRVTATNLDTTVTRRIAAVLEGAGAVLVNGRKLNKILKELPETCILNISAQDEEVMLVCDASRTRYRLPTLPVDEFPSPPKVMWDEDGFAVDAAVLAGMIARTAFAVSTEETRPILNGVSWELRPAEMTMVATNGHRLSAARVECGTGRTDDLILLPPALLRVASLAAESAPAIRVAHTQNHVGFRGDTWEVISRLIEGPYPDWRKVVPDDNDRALVADRAAFIAAVRRMGVLAEGQTHRIRLSLSGEMLTFSVANSGVGTGDQEIPVEYEGDPLEIGFNAEYLLELLGSIQTGEVKLTFKAPERAATLHPVLAPDEVCVITHDVLVMPLRLQ
jgi:DNA polymerase-3 subunit beta